MAEQSSEQTITWEPDAWWLYVFESSRGASSPDALEATASGLPGSLADLTRATLGEHFGRLEQADRAFAALAHAKLEPRWARVRDLVALRLGLRRGHGYETTLPAARALVARTPESEAQTRARAEHLIGSLCTRLEQYDEAELALMRALELVGTSGYRLWILDGLAQILLYTGAWTEAARTLEAIVRMKGEVRDLLGIAITAGHAALMHLERGQPAEAEALSRHVLERCGGVLEPVSRMRHQTMIVQACLDAGKRTDAEREAAALEVLVGAIPPGPHHLAGFAALALARGAEARGDASATERWLARAEASFEAPAGQALAHYWRARLVPGTADDPAWQRGQEELFERSGAASEAEVRTWILLAEGAHTRGDRDRMRALLDRALERAAAANNWGWVELADGAFRHLDPPGYGERVVERFSGRSAGELKRTTKDDATIVFADLAGFTARSQELPPEVVMETVRSVFELAVPLLRRERVRPLQHLGDGLLAVAEGPDHEARGLRFAFELVRKTSRVTRIRRALGESWGLDLRAGVASGEVVLGLLGSQYKLEYLAIGRTTNLAARLQSRAEVGEVIASEQTVDAATALEGRQERLVLKGFPGWGVTAYRFRA